MGWLVTMAGLFLRLHTLDGVLACDQAGVAAARAPSQAKLGFNSTAATDDELSISTACIEEQHCTAPEALLLRSSLTS